MEDLKQFISKYSKDYFFYLKKYTCSFPNCCFLASNILGSYLLAKGYNVKLIEGNKKRFANNTKFHMWLLVTTDNNEEIVIDFTLFQFYIDKFNKFKKYKTDEEIEEVYDYCIGEIQRENVIFSKDYYYKLFNVNKDCSDEFSFIENAENSKSFSDFLTTINL